MTTEFEEADLDQPLRLSHCLVSIHFPKFCETVDSLFGFLAVAPSRFVLELILARSPA
ncbi:MAG: hypothetical protein WBD78_17285 [Methylocella sp.]